MPRKPLLLDRLYQFRADVLDVAGGLCNEPRNVDCSQYRYHCANEHIGHAQANRIYNRLVTELGAEVMEKHRIMCGGAATFQGQERDVVFLSMVSCPETSTALTSRIFEQRFNVAASRARDRLVLVRSVASSHLKPTDLKLALIEHFRDPMKMGAVIKPREVLDLCQSDLEREFGRCLLDLGYRIRSQVPVGGYSIDFVIEGDDDRRLAIELDGDKYHGPDRWADDIRRQRTLERLGWVFWRCWGSAWNSDRDGCVSDLQGTLERLGIGPLGMAEAGGVYTQHVEIEPPAPTAPTIAEVAQVAEMVSHATPLVPDSEFGAPSLLGNTIDLSQTLRPPASANGGEAPTISADFAGNSIAVGDLVIVRYNDQPERPVTIRLSEEVNRPSDGVVHVSEPLAAAILGGSVDDVVEIEVAGRQRTAVIEKIEKAREVTPATGQPFRPI